MSRQSIILSCFFFFIVTVISIKAGDAVQSVAPPSVIYELLALNRDLPTLQFPKYLSPTALVPSSNGEYLYVAEQTAKRIAVIDVQAQAVTGHILLPNEVTGLTISRNGTVLYATCSSEQWPAGMICIVNVPAKQVVLRIPVGYGARAPVITPDGSKLYICNQFDDDISIVDLGLRKETGRIKLLREPYCAAITSDGAKLVVANMLPSEGPTPGDTSSFWGKVSIIDAAEDTVIEHLYISRGSVNLQGITITPDNRYAFVTHTIGKYGLINTTLEKGWLHTDNVAVIDLDELFFVNDVCLDHSDRAFNAPWGIQCSADTAYVCITHAGSGELSLFDYHSFLDTILVFRAQTKDMQQLFTAFTHERTIIPTGTSAPRALALIGNTAFTVGYYSDETPSVKIFNLSLEETGPIAEIPLGPSTPQTCRRKGEASFYDATVSYQSWHSCHSCHPFGRTDGMYWILGGRGDLVAPKNTKSLIYSWWTPPAHWSGFCSTAHEANRDALEFKLFVDPTDDIIAPLDTFLMHLTPIPSPQLVKGRLSEEAQRGRQFFYDTSKVNCSLCHTPPLFTNNRIADVGTPDPHDENKDWVTPSLREVWRSRHYNHIGTDLTLKSIIVRQYHNNASVNLTDSEIDDLVAYIGSL